MKKLNPKDLEKLTIDTKLDHAVFPWRTVVVYLLFGLLWIGLSDRILRFFVDDMQHYQSIQSIKGWIFVFISSAIIYIVLRLEYRKIFSLTEEVSSKNQELVTFAEELVAMEEELQNKLEALYKTTDLLTDQKRFVEEIFENSNTAIMVWNLRGEVVDVNHYFTEVFGYSVEEIVGKKWTDLMILDEDKPRVKSIIAELREKYRVSNFENRVIDKYGAILTILWNDTLIYDPGQDAFRVVSFGIDLTRQREQERQILEMAYTDRLTGLKNRVVFENEVNLLIEQEKPFTIYYMDIDHFKNLNDIHGHLYGDLFLKKLGDALKLETDFEYIYRWCGDEFLIMVVGQPDEGVIQKLKGILQRHWQLKEVVFSPTASIGITQFPEDGIGVQKLLMNADLALHKAKLGGKGHVEYFHKRFQVELERVSIIEEALGKAIEANALDLYFQPIYDLNTRAIVSVEILLRWFDPRIQMTTGEFINIAEQTGQIIKVDQWVIENAFCMIATHFNSAPPCVFSINLSAQSFNLDTLVPFLIGLQAQYHINPRDIEFEITEYSILHNTKEAQSIMMLLKEMGFRISLDDFGTRYSSLNYLGKLPFDQLKIDKSYVDYILTDSVDQAIVELLSGCVS